MNKEYFIAGKTGEPKPSLEQIIADNVTVYATGLVTFYDSDASLLMAYMLAPEESLIYVGEYE